MKTYQAKMLSTTRDAAGASYPFEAPDDLFRHPADRVVRAFFEHVDKDIFHHHVDYEINSAFKSADGQTVSAMGSLVLKNDSHLPFLLLIHA